MGHKLSAIVLAAGMGTRLGDLTSNIPKALVTVAGHPLISYALRFLRNMGVDNLVVVGGFHHDQLAKTVSVLDPDAVIIENEAYRKGTLYSLAAGLPHVESDLIVWHGDHIFPLRAGKQLLQAFGEGVTAMTDTDRDLTNDDMKIALNEHGSLVAISKQLCDYDRGYIGITSCSRDALPLYRNAVDGAANLHGDRAVSEDAMRYLVEHGTEVQIGDMSGFSWYEVDYPEELARAESGITKRAIEFGL